MPRNKGYTPMRADARNLTDSPINGTTSCCVTASVRYAKIDTAASRPRPPRSARPPKPDPPPRYTSPPSSSSTLSGTTVASKESSASASSSTTLTCPGVALNDVTRATPHYVALPQTAPILQQQQPVPLTIQLPELVENRTSDENPVVQETPLVIRNLFLNETDLVLFS